MNAEFPRKPSAEEQLVEIFRQRHFYDPNLNIDPISKETYSRVLNKLIHEGDVVVNLGAGVAIDITESLNSLNKEISTVCEKKKATLLAIDIRHENLVTHNDYKEIVKNSTLHPIQADALSLPLTEGSVSGIVSSNLINCPPNGNITIREQGVKLIREAWRTLRPGGFLLLSSFGYNPEGTDASGRKVFNDDITEGEILSLGEIQSILTETGFIDISELEIDEERIVYLFGRNKHKENGGFIAYKPRNG